MNNKEGFQRHVSKTGAIALVILLMALFSTSAAAGDFDLDRGLKSVKITDTVDQDGDGYVSSFTVTITANARVDERGGDYTGGVFSNDGHPSYSVTIGVPGTKTGFLSGMYTESANSKHVEFDMEFDWQDMQDERGEYSDNSPHNKRIHDEILNGERDVDKVTVIFWESDTPHDVDPWKDERIGAKSATSSFKGIESPSQDKTEPVSIESRPSGATVYIDGEKKGTTDWTGRLPTDMEERGSGFATVRLEKDGYKTLTDKTRLSPPDDRNYDLKKEKKSLVLDSNPDDATVYINGQEIGKTPVSKKYWVKEAVDVRVEKDGYEAETAEDVAPGRHKFFTLEAINDTNDTDDSGDYDFYDPYDPVLEPEFTSLDYQLDLVNTLPDLRGWFVADFNVSSKTVKSNEPVTFDASGSYNMGGNIAAYSWDFGDGASTGAKTAPTVMHSYDSPGNYTVNLTVEGGNGSTTFATTHVVVENQLPTPAFDLGTKTVIEGKSVVLDAGRAADPDGDIASYTWDMGDGTTKTGEKVSYVYDNSGEYIVNLEVTDNHGATETVTRTVKVLEENMEPDPQFTASSSTVDVGETVNFDASGSVDPDGMINQYYWDFGDGLSDTGAQVEHNYSHSGTYTVDLTVLDDRQESVTVDKEITVEGDGDGSGSADTDSTEDADDQSDSDQSGNAGDGGSGGSPIRIIVDFFQSLFG